MLNGNDSRSIGNIPDSNSDGVAQMGFEWLNVFSKLYERRMKHDDPQLIVK